MTDQTCREIKRLEITDSKQPTFLGSILTRPFL